MYILSHSIWYSIKIFIILLFFLRHSSSIATLGMLCSIEADVLPTQNTMQETLHSFNIVLWVSAPVSMWSQECIQQLSVLMDM